MPCESCLQHGLCRPKTGLPIFLALYGTAAMPGAEGPHFEKGAAIRNRMDISNSKAPELSGNFKVDEPIDLGGCTFYTLRPLRGGYVYTYDEARKKWETYFVTDNGFLVPLHRLYRNVSDELVLLNPQAVPCLPENLHKGMLVNVPDPESATVVWIGYSGVEWTKDVFERHQDASHRARHMRKFNVKAWMASQDQPHAGKIADLAKHVADFAEGVNPGAFLFSPSAQGPYAFPLLARGAKEYYWKNPDPSKPPIPVGDTGKYPPDELERIYKFNNNWPYGVGPSRHIIDASERILPGKGAIVALNDPAGIAQELAELMAFRLEAFERQPRFEGKLAASTQILLLQKFVEDKATGVTAEKIGNFEKWLAADEQYRKDYKAWTERMRPGSGLPPCPPPVRSYAASMVDSSTFMDVGRKPDAPNLHTPLSDSEIAALFKASQEAGWKKFSEDKGVPRYDEVRRKAFQEDYDQKYAQYAEAIIKPIAQAHAKWMKSDMLAQYFACNFSTEVPKQGGQYTETLSLCIRDTQQFAPCAEVYAEWMNGDPGDEKNLIMQALVMNQRETWEQVREHLSKRLALQQRGVKLLEKLESGTSDTLDAGIAQEVRDFAVEWGALFMEGWKKVARNVSDAFAPIPSDPPPPNSALARLRLQLIAATLEHYQKAGHDSTVGVLLELHDKNVHAPAFIKGDQRELMGLTVRSVAVRETTYLDTTLERGRVAQLIGSKEGGAPKTVSTSLAYSVEAIVAGFVEEQGRPTPRATYKNLLRIILGRAIQMQARNVPHLTFSMSITNGSQIRAFTASLDTAESPLVEERRRQHVFSVLGSKPAIPTYSASIAALSFWTVRDLYQKMDNPTEWDRQYESGTRFAGAGLLLVSSAADTYVRVMEATGKYHKANNFAQAGVTSKSERLFRMLASSKLGVPAAGVGAYWNYKGAGEEWKRGNDGVMTAHLAAMGVDVAAGFSLFFQKWWTRTIPGPVGWGLLVAGFVLSLVITSIKDSNTKRYLSQCAFGKENQGWDAEKERKMFEQAV